MGTSRQYRCLPGCLASKKNPDAPEFTVAIYDSSEAGYRGRHPFTVVCHAHDLTLGVDTMVAARAAFDHPERFCYRCEAALKVRAEVEAEAKRREQAASRQRWDGQW